MEIEYQYNFCFIFSAASTVSHAAGVQVPWNEWQLYHQDLLAATQHLQ